jgi:hypothetical protein
MVPPLGAKEGSNSHRAWFDCGGAIEDYAVIKEFPAASLTKLTNIEITFFKAEWFRVNISENQPNRTFAFLHLIQNWSRDKKRPPCALVALANYSHVS